jgi:hypothetical protein
LKENPAAIAANSYNFLPIDSTAEWRKECESSRLERELPEPVCPVANGKYDAMLLSEDLHA